MIFVTLGSQKFQFNRLLKAVDHLIEQGKLEDEVFAQIGYSDYRPQYYKFKQFFDRNGFEEMEENADIVITHGGTGAIVGAVKKGKKVIAVPRLSEYEEHVDNHQKQIIKQFSEMNLIYGVWDCNELEEALKNIKIHKFDSYKSCTQCYIESIEKYIKDESNSRNSK